MSFLLYFTLFALTFLQISSENPEDLRKAIRACKTNSGVSHQNLLKMRQGERVNDTKLLKYALCAFKQTGCIDDSGILQIDVIRKRLTVEYRGNVENAEKVAQECAIQRETPEVTAYETILCGYALKRAASFIKS